MNCEIKWSKFAISNLEEIKKYISNDSSHYAEIVVRNIYNSVDRLKIFPLSGRIVSEFNNKNIREILVYNYRIVYRIDDIPLTVEIITIHHSAMLLDTSFINSD